MKFVFQIMKSFMLKTGDDVVSPLYDGITLIGPYAISVCLVLSTFWAIFLGAKYAKAEDASEKEKLHKVLVNFIIGALTVMFLIILIYVLREPLVKLIDSDA